MTHLFQWFLIALSVRPGIRFAISAHLLPNIIIIYIIILIRVTEKY